MNFENPNFKKEQSVEKKESMAEKEKSFEKEPSPAMKKHFNWAEKATRFALEKIAKTPKEVLIPGGVAITAFLLTAPLSLNMVSPVEINQTIALGIGSGIATIGALAGTKIAEKMVERDQNLDNNKKSLIKSIEYENKELEYRKRHLTDIEKSKLENPDVNWNEEVRMWSKLVKKSEKTISVREKKLARINSRFEKLGQTV
jgi:hypothetical protein